MYAKGRVFYSYCVRAGHHNRHVLRALVLAKFIIFKTRKLVEHQCSTVRIQCAWQMRTARCKKEVEGRVQYTAVLTRIRAKKELLSRLVETSPQQSSLRGDGLRSWQYMAVRATQFKKRTLLQTQTSLLPHNLVLSYEEDTETLRSNAPGHLQRILR